MNKFLFSIFLFILLFMPLASAEKGVGIVWSTQSETVAESKTTCVNYGVYNPFDEDATVYLTASGDLANLVQDSKPITIPAGTTHDFAKQVSLCFKIPKTYSTCAEQEKVYEGDVLAVMKSTASDSGAAGSATQAAASAPLTLKVVCEEQNSTSWIPVIIVAGLLIAFGAIVLKKKRKK